MRSYTRIVETASEVMLAVVLIAIIAFSFTMTLSISPAPRYSDQPVLGLSVDSKPYELLTHNYFEQTRFLGSNNSFQASYIFAIDQEQLVRSYDLLRFSNGTLEPRRYLVRISGEPEDLQYYRISLRESGREQVVYDALNGAALFDVIVSLDPQSESVAALKLARYSETAPLELPLEVYLEVLP